MAQGDDDTDAPTVVGSPSFDEMMAARGETYDEGTTAVDARPFDERLAAQLAEKSHDPIAFAATVTGAPSYDAQLEARGLPVPSDDPAAPWAVPAKDPSVPKTMVLPPQAWGLPPAGAPPPSFAPPSGAQPALGGSPPDAPSYAGPPPGAPIPTASARPVRRYNGLWLFALSAGVTLLVFGTCGAAILAYLAMRG